MVHNIWWQLPGPSNFTLQIAQDIRDGKNAILCFPEHMPDDIRHALMSHLDSSEGWSWRTIDVTEGKMLPPAFQLYSRFIPDFKSDTILNAYTLSKEESFASYLIWLEGITKDLWPNWKQFIKEYAHACRSIPLFDRTIFCIPITGEVSFDLPEEDVCLTHHYWRGVVNSLDMLMFTSNMFQNKDLPDLQKKNCCCRCY